MGTAYDPDSGFIAQHFRGRALFSHDIPGDDEPEIKFLHPPKYFALIQRVLAESPDIILCPHGMQAKDYVLTNLGLDTLDAKNPGDALHMFNHGYQCRMRLKYQKGGFPSRMELNIKSNLGPDNPRNEYEAPEDTFEKCFLKMTAHEGVRSDGKLDFASVDKKTLFVHTVAATMRAHGEFAHVMKKHNCVIRYMQCSDQTSYLDPFGGFAGGDFESELEAMEVFFFTPGIRSDEHLREIIAESQKDLFMRLLALSPDEMWNSRKSKMGRAVKKCARLMGLEPAIAVRGLLGNGISVNHVLGVARHPSFPGYDFAGALARNISEHAMSPEKLMRYIYPVEEDFALDIPVLAAHP